ncbi:MAG TPA: hypothetical protein PKC40_00155 [Saprospiraceae bacterium]|nr:hypothetical protein [Saprospiraceae bacterium]
MAIKIKDLHESTLKYLINEGSFFLTRKINRGHKLENGMWFHGNSFYMNISFWQGFDNDRKVNNIGFGIDIDEKAEVYLQLTARNDKGKIDLLDKIASKIKAKKNDSTDNHWFKIYGTKVQTIDDFLKYLNEFLITDKKIIDEIIEKEENPEIRFLTSEIFGRQIEIINHYRNSFDLISPKIEVIDKSGSIRFRRQALDNMDIKITKRETSEGISILDYEHRKMQNQLKKQLELEYPDSKICLEKDYIDLLMITETSYLLVEIKPSSNVTNCIKQGIGQLLFYFTKFSNKEGKKVELAIAGLNEPNDADQEFIRSLRTLLNITLKYIKIEMLSDSNI